MTSPRKSKALMVLFPGFNTLDMNGPYEVLRRSGRSSIFTITVASETEITTSVEGVQVKRDVPLDKSLVSSLEEYDLLVVPGGTMDAVNQQAAKLDGYFMSLIEAFPKISPTEGQPPRIIFSICTGAIFLGALGVYDGLYCTTHWAAYVTLVQATKAGAARTQGQPGTVLPARFIDAGLNAAKVRVISSGGVSCGMDGALHVVKIRSSEEEARTTAELIDYGWRKTEGVVFDANFGSS